LMASGEDLPEQVQAIVADSPYSRATALFGFQMKRMFHLPSFPVSHSTSGVATIRAAHPFKGAAAMQQVDKAAVPRLSIHGNNDTLVPADMARKLYENTKSDAEIMTVDDANHGESFVIAKEQYIKKLHAFLDQYVQ